MIEYAKAVGNSLQAAQNLPKEIGILDRVAGLAGGLAELRRRLDTFSSKLHAHPPQGESTEAEVPPMGIRDNLQLAEAQLRTCMNLIDDLHSQL